jgi:hypothetical protein
MKKTPQSDNNNNIEKFDCRIKNIYFISLVDTCITIITQRCWKLNYT